MARPSDRWDAHPVLAWWVRAGVLLVPLCVSVLVALVLIALLPEPDGGAQVVGWWVLVLGAAFGAAQLVDRVARRALPLAVLLRLSLVFPDRAPSRLRAARRTSLREIEHQVASLHTRGGHGEPGEAARTLVSLVGALGLHDKRTRGHSERVRAYVDMLTEEMRLPEDDRARLRWAALLHDIGKLSVPQPLLNGSSELGEQEWAVLRRHPVDGERLAGGLLPWLGEWGRCVREHHERWDGSGYPAGLQGEQISLGARIVAVADAYEVMTANRSYRAAVGPRAAREELARCAGTDFDPAVVRAFLQISLGRLRGVLGPLSLLPALPFTAAADRAGQAARGLTQVAAVGVVTLAVAGGSVVTPAPSPQAPPPSASAPVVSPPQPARAPVALPAPTATPGARPASSPAPAVTRAPSPSSSASPAPAPAPSPDVEAVRVLYLTASGSLVVGPPGEGSGPLSPGAAGLTFSAEVTAPLQLGAAPAVVLWTRVVPRHGSGNPRARVSVLLQDCDDGGCRTIARTSGVLRRARQVVQQRLLLTRGEQVVPAGHVLRLTLRLVARDNVDSVLIGYGGSRPSRLELG